MKNKLSIKIILTFAFGIMSFLTFAQQKIGTSPGVLEPSAVLELGSSDATGAKKGFLAPRVSLASISTYSLGPVGTAAVNGMMVYNTATVGGNVTPGFYVWSGGATGSWKPMTAVSSVTNGNGLALSETGVLSYTLSSGSIGETTIINNAVTYEKMQKVSASRLLGNPTGASANVSEISLGTGLSFSGSTLNVSVGAGQIADASITPVKLTPSGTTGQVLTTTGAGTTASPFVTSWQPIPASSNIYTADGILAGARTVTQGTNNLSFVGTGKTMFGSFGNATPANNTQTTLNSGRVGILGAGNNILSIMNDGTSTVGNMAGISFRTQGNLTSIGHTAFVSANQTDATTAATALLFGTYNGTAATTERMRIAPNGNVGIGTTAPTVPLELSRVRTVANDTIPQMIISSSTSSLTENYGINFRGTPSGAYFGYIGSRSDITPGPAIVAGIGKDINFFTSAEPGVGVNGGTVGDAYNVTSTENVLRMKIIPNKGYVGIGQNISLIAPTANLHVNGTLRFDSTGVIPSVGQVLMAVNANGTAQWGTLGSTSLGTGSVTSTTIADGTIATADIADRAITTDKLTPSGTAGQVLMTTGNGTTASPFVASWQTPIVTSVTSGNGLTLTSGVLAFSPASSSIGSTQIADGSIANSDLANMAALSVKGNATNASAVPTDIAATVDGQVLRRSGTSIGFGTISAAGITDASITAAKLTPSGTTGQILMTTGAGTTASPFVTSWGAIPAASNIYTANGTLTGGRTVSQSTFDLTFEGAGEIIKYGTTAAAPRYRLGRTTTVEADFGVAHVATNGFPNTAAGDAYLRTVGTSSTSNMILGTIGTGALRLMTGSTERVTVTSGGNVGIGTTSPVQPLHTVGNVRFDVIPGLNTSGTIRLGRQNTPTPIRFHDIEVGSGGNDWNFITFKLHDDTETTPGSNTFDGTKSVLTMRGAGTVGILSTAPTSTLDVNGSISKAILRITGARTLDATDYTIIANAFTAGFAITLPAPSTCTGREYVIRKVDESSNAITFTFTGITGSNAIRVSDNSATVGTYISSLNYTKTLRIQSDGVDWYLID